MVCFAFSRDAANCKGPEDGCYKQHRRLTDAEKLKRDQVEQSRVKAGKPIGYPRSADQASAAAANVESNKGQNDQSSVRSRSSDRDSKGKPKGKGKGKGKGGKDAKCRAFMETGKCTRGKDCWFKETTPGHP